MGNLCQQDAEECVFIAAGGGAVTRELGRLQSEKLQSYTCRQSLLIRRNEEG